MTRTADQVRTVRIEVRMGNRTGPAHADGRRGHVVAAGEVDAEWPGWWRSLEKVPLPPGLPPVYVYVGNDSLEPAWSNTAQSTEQIAAADTALAADVGTYGTVAAALAHRRGEVDRLEARVALLDQLAAAAERRLARVQEEEEAAHRSLLAERERVARERAALDAESRTTRELAQREREAALREVEGAQEASRRSKEACAQELEAFLASARKQKELALTDLELVATRLTGLGSSLVELEGKAAENVASRKLLAQAHLQESLDLYDNLEQNGRTALVGGERRETPTDKLATALAQGLESGAVIREIRELVNAFRPKAE